LGFRNIVAATWELENVVRTLFDELSALPKNPLVETIRATILLVAAP
jgi:hypothetical protein